MPKQDSSERCEGSQKEVPKWTFLNILFSFSFSALPCKLIHFHVAECKREDRAISIFHIEEINQSCLM